MSYACECSGEVGVGREHPEITEGIRATMESMTGYDVATCPWSAYRDPHVQRVMRAYPFFERGMLAVYCPDPSRRLLDSLSFFDAANNRMRGKQMDMETEKRRAEVTAMRNQAMNGGGNRG